MTSIDTMTARAAVELGFPAALVGKVYKAYWTAVREHVSSLPLKEALPWEEVRKLKPCVNVPRLGKLALTEGRYNAMISRYVKQLKRLQEDAVYT